MTDLLLRRGLVLSPDGGQTVDILIENGRIVSIGPALSNDAMHPEFDATGCWVGPGFVDIHTHLREPGHEYKEDIKSGSQAAALGGYTAVVAMPNTMPAIDSGHIARLVAARGREVGLIEVQPAGAVTLGRQGNELAHLDELWEAGSRIFTDDGDPVADSGLMRQALEYIGDLGGVVSQHCEDKGLSRGGHMHEGSVSSLLGIRGIPPASEDIVVARDIALSEMTDRPVHFQHLSSARSVELIADARLRGVPVTAEVTPHHLMFTDKEIEAGTDPAFKMHPPLRTESDRQGLIEGLRHGVIDVVATDHAPHVTADKEVPFEEAANGVIGLETAAAVVNTVLQPDAAEFFSWMSTGPAGIARMANHGRYPTNGELANLVVFDPNARWIPGTYASKSTNSPYTGLTLTGKVRLTVSMGRTTSSEGQLT
ncbi:MAG: dihydroorotase [Acidimicrobiia bacterium]|nr:dihydroorotase [Acidimicrobiia bacterium]